MEFLVWGGYDFPIEKREKAKEESAVVFCLLGLLRNHDQTNDQMVIHSLIELIFWQQLDNLLIFFLNGGDLIIRNETSSTKPKQ